jgi:hypothetical protein
MEAHIAQAFLLVKLKSSIRKFDGRHHDLADCYGIYVSQMTALPSSFLIHDLSPGL